MADLSEFESAEQPQAPTEDDPAAAFLAREQDQLAELEGDSLGADSSQPPADDGFDPFGAEAGPAESSEDIFGDGAQEPQTGGDGNMLDEFGDNSAPNSFSDQIGGESNDTLTNGPTDTYSAISHVDRQRAEPEKIKKWREEQTKMLEKKDEEEEKKREEWRSQAKKELEDWYKHNAEQLTKTKENNRAAEAAFVKERDETTSGHNWEKICRLCEFNPKNSKNMKDISRLRSILLQLKQTPLER
ncbi:clathrin light chain B-like isoform X1 [Liolophura sinensis]|uniref:clathrin light chain B-like isoform X1 n=1 Tax=Liolophura sinensis TaxID=3198878 RepID=UPI003159677B